MTSLTHWLGCRFPVSSADFWLCLRKFCGKADRGRLAGQRREFKIHRKSTAQEMTPVEGTDSDARAQRSVRFLRPSNELDSNA